MNVQNKAIVLKHTFSLFHISKPFFVINLGGGRKNLGGNVTQKGW